MARMDSNSTLLNSYVRLMDVDTEACPAQGSGLACIAGYATLEETRFLGFPAALLHDPMTMAFFDFAARGGGAWKRPCGFTFRPSATYLYCTAIS